MATAIRAIRKAKGGARALLTSGIRLLSASASNLAMASAETAYDADDEVRIGVAASTLDRRFSVPYDVHGVSIDFMRSKLNKRGIFSAFDLRQHSPRDIAAFGREFVDENDAVLMPGTPNTLPKEFRAPPEPIKTMSTSFFSWVLRMAVASHAIKTGKPLLMSCEAMGCGTILAGGEVESIIKIPKPTDDSRRPAIHYPMGAHDIIVLPDSWLHALASQVEEEFTGKRPAKDASILLPMVASTHPLFSSVLPPEKTRVLATAPDGTAAYVSYFPEQHPYVLGIQDHPESGPPPTPRAGEKPGGLDGHEEVEPDFRNLALYKRVADTLTWSARHVKRHPLPPEKLDEIQIAPHIEEILELGQGRV